jgi:nicotinamidase-related amidase
MDMQSGVVGLIPDAAAALLPTIRKAIDAAHERKIPVIYVTITFRPGFPEVSANNKGFSRIAKSGAGFADPAAAAVHPDLAPAEGDIVVVKRRVSAFAGSDLELILRAQKVERLTLCGIATSGVVLSTVREAADKDYVLTVLSDGCADMDEDVHNLLLSKVINRQAEVVTCAEWAAAGSH